MNISESGLSWQRYSDDVKEEHHIERVTVKTEKVTGIGGKNY